MRSAYRRMTAWHSGTLSGSSTGRWGITAPPCHREFNVESGDYCDDWGVERKDQLADRWDALDSGGEYW